MIPAPRVPGTGSITRSGVPPQGGPDPRMARPSIVGVEVLVAARFAFERLRYYEMKLIIDFHWTATEQQWT